jgi:hypothetical protein
LTPSKGDAACYAGGDGSVAQVTLRVGAVKRLAADVEDLEKPISEARAQGVPLFRFPDRHSWD